MKVLRKRWEMGRRDIRAAWLAGGLAWLALGLGACVEPARSADVPPELAPKMATGAGAVLAKHAASDSNGANSKQGTLAATAAAPAPSEPALPADPSDGDFFGLPDAPIREALRNKAPLSIEKGRGGRSLGFKIVLEGGQKAYFKGEQVFSAANWFGEVAAYHLDRMLKLGRVPAVVSRQFAWSQLEPAAGNDWRKPEMIVRNGQLRGAFVAWVDGGVRPLTQKEGWERWLRVKYWPTAMVTPFQRPAVWAQEHAQVRKLGQSWRSAEERARLRMLRPEPDRDDRPAELSDLIVFDYLIKNLDRWGGGNANVLMRGDKGPLIFLDNAAGFEAGDPRPALIESRLRALQRFRRSTIAAVRAFDIKEFEKRLASEPVQPVLNRAQLDGLETRRKALLAWVGEMQAMHGEAIWAWE
jgi:hypothetical protein